MDIGEAIALPAFEASLAQEYEAKCPFDEDESGGPKRPKEDIEDDDLPDVQELQKNDGGVLGRNIEAGRAGDADGGPYSPGSFLYKQAADDTERGRGSKVRLKSFQDIDAGDFPFTVAAHHLIPGNAALYKKNVKIIDYMEKDGEVQSLSGKTYTIKHHIGYDVNGSHNGVWLPGNYAIRKARPAYSHVLKDEKRITVEAKPGTTPVEGLSWEELSTDHEPWQFDYIAGAMKAANGQFHDSHEDPYSANVRKFLNKISTMLAAHQDACLLCRGKNEPIPPPYRIKQRLYAISSSLRAYVTGQPASWKHPWFTSQRWSKKYFRGGKLTEDFQAAFRDALETNPRRTNLP